MPATHHLSQDVPYGIAEQSQQQSSRGHPQDPAQHHSCRLLSSAAIVTAQRAVLLLLAAGSISAAQAAPWYEVVLIGPESSTGTGINGKGDLTGTYIFGNGSFITTDSYVTSYGMFGARATRFYAINDFRDAVGTALLRDYTSTAIRYSQSPRGPGEGAFSRVPLPPDDFDSIATAINNAGTVVGTYTNSARRGFVSSGGTYTTLSPDAQSGAAYDINNNGTIVGQAFRNGTNEAVVYVNGVENSLGNFGGSAYADAVSENGLVVGAFTAGATTRWRSFIYDGAGITVLEDPLRNVVPKDINSDGMVVGVQSMLNDPSDSEVFLYAAGQRIPLSSRLAGPAEWRLVDVVAINDLGQIAANACHLTARMCRAVRLDVTPVPEPAGWAMLLAGMGLLARQARRRG